jgi:hypothetical protein
VTPKKKKENFLHALRLEPLRGRKESRIALSCACCDTRKILGLFLYAVEVIEWGGRGGEPNAR